MLNILFTVHAKQAVYGGIIVGVLCVLHDWCMRKWMIISSFTFCDTKNYNFPPEVHYKMLSYRRETALQGAL